MAGIPVGAAHRCDDDGFLGALQPVDLLFEFGDPLLSLRRWIRRIRNLIDREHQTVNQHILEARRAHPVAPGGSLGRRTQEFGAKQQAAQASPCG